MICRLRYIWLYDYVHFLNFVYLIYARVIPTSPSTMLRINSARRNPWRESGGKSYPPANRDRFRLWLGTSCLTHWGLRNQENIPLMSESLRLMSMFHTNWRSTNLNISIPSFLPHFQYLPFNKDEKIIRPASSIKPGELYFFNELCLECPSLKFSLIEGHYVRSLSFYNR